MFHVTILTLSARGWDRLGDLALCAEGIDGDGAFEADGLEGQSSRSRTREKTPQETVINRFLSIRITAVWTKLTWTCLRRAHSRGGRMD